MPDLTQERLKQLVHYDPLTGVFTALVAGPRRPVGARVGAVTSKGYMQAWVGGSTRRMNRLAWLYMTGEWPPEFVDHVDRDRSNDAWANLRLANNAENSRNCKLSKRNASGVKGVLYRERAGRRPEWWASIRVDRKLLHIGIFRSLPDAASARRAAELLHFGAFAPA